MTHLPWILGVLAVSGASIVSAQPVTHCRNEGAVITCTSAAPVSDAAAVRIFTTATTPYTPDVPAIFVPPIDWRYVGAVHGPTFSDSWPYESAGIYRRLFTPSRGRSRGRR